MTSTEHCPSELSCCSFRSNLWAQPTSQVPVGTWEMRGKRQLDKGNFRRQIKGRHWGRPGERGREWRGGADGPKIDLGQRQRLGSALPETKEHLLSGRQEGASQWLDLSRKTSGSFRSHPCQWGKTAEHWILNYREDSFKTQAYTTADNFIVMMKVYECILGQSKNNKWKIIIKNALRLAAKQTIKINSFSYVKYNQLKI